MEFSKNMWSLRCGEARRCPLCGGEAGFPRDSDGYVPYCTKCLSHLSFHVCGLSDAIKAWNDKDAKLGHFFVEEATARQKDFARRIWARLGVSLPKIPSKENLKVYISQNIARFKEATARHNCAIRQRATLRLQGAFHGDDFHECCGDSPSAFFGSTEEIFS